MKRSVLVATMLLMAVNAAAPSPARASQGRCEGFTIGSGECQTTFIVGGSGLRTSVSIEHLAGALQGMSLGAVFTSATGTRSYFCGLAVAPPPDRECDVLNTGSFATGQEVLLQVEVGGVGRWKVHGS